jgi:hypothetical protein
MPDPNLPAFETRLNALLLEFDHLQDAWPKGRNAVLCRSSGLVQSAAPF